jgi:hypothetical protein
MPDQVHLLCEIDPQLLPLRIQNKNLRLSDREWLCPECKGKQRRDHNAAQNLGAEGIRQLTRRISFAIAMIVIAVGMRAQSADPTIYAESFRKHATRVTEESFEAKLTPDNPTYRERIKDSAGNDRYELTIVPQGPEGDNKITSWRVALGDLEHTIYSNLLVADQQPSTDAKNTLWWLNPNPSVAVPIRARRIVKVDGFYVVIEVKDLHFTPLDSPYLDSMTVKFMFTNSDPRAPR